MSLILALAAGAQIAIVGMHGPELRDVPPSVERFVRREEPKSTKPKCLKPARLFNYVSHALDIASTVAAIDNGAVEANPMVTSIFGKRPSAGELILFKAIPMFGVRMLDEHLVSRGRTKTACVLNIGFGIPGLVAAGLNSRFVF